MDRPNIAFKNIFLEDEYLNLDKFSDAQLLTEDGYSFKVHRIILAKENSYFKALFKYNNQKSIVVRGVTGKTLDQILCFIYARIVPTNPENMHELFIASDFFLVDKLKFHLRKYLMGNISLENCVATHLISLQINDVELINISYRFIQTNFQTLIRYGSLNFKEMPLETLEQFLQDRNLCVTGEHIVWMCVEKWIKQEGSERLCELPRLIKCLKVAEIDEALANTIIHSDVINKYEQLVDCRNLYILNHVICSPDGSCQMCRIPKRLHIAIQHVWAGAAEDVTLYVTYDEKIDLWKKLAETETRPTDVMVVGHRVYILDSYYNSNMIFDLQEREWSNMPLPRTERWCYCAVTLGENIFILGGLDEITNEWILGVEFYNTETGMSQSSESSEKDGIFLHTVDSIIIRTLAKIFAIFLRFVCQFFII